MPSSSSNRLAALGARFSRRRTWLARRLERFERLPPAFLPILWFAVQIVVGALLLWLPASRSDASDAGFSTALFTAASAACVTGLATVDIASFYSPFGKAVIAVWIEIGGLGVMTFAALGFQLFRTRLSLTTQAALDDSLFQRSAARDFRRAFGRILKTVFVIQGAGALLLFPALWIGHRGDPEYGNVGFCLASALFHAVAAFCNAGISLYPDSLSRFDGHPAVLTVIMALIVLGGIGHTVLLELRQAWRRFRRVGVPFGRAAPMSLNTRTALWVTAIIIAGTAAGLGLVGLRGTGGVSVSWLTTLFQAVSARTAGFHVAPVESIPLAGLLLITLAMFIGGSPGSCAGGVKTTSAAVLFAWLRSAARGEAEAHWFDRALPPGLIHKTMQLVALAVIWNGAGVFVLSITEFTEAAAVGRAGTPEGGWGLMPLVFEQISAFGTVGLTTGVTPTLSACGKLWIAASMYMGRLGPLALVMGMAPAAPSRVRRADGRLMIG